MNEENENLANSATKRVLSASVHRALNFFLGGGIGFPASRKHFQVSGFKMNPGYNKNLAIILSLSSIFLKDKAPVILEKEKANILRLG